MLTFMSACIATCEQLRNKYGHDFSETDNKQVGYYSTGILTTSEWITSVTEHVMCELFT